MAERPVHYCAHGSSGLSFRCYDTEIAKWAKGYSETRVERRDGVSLVSKYSGPQPRRHTDLRNVTCPDCWREIAEMARAAIAKAKA